MSNVMEKLAESFKVLSEYEADITVIPIDGICVCISPHEFRYGFHWRKLQELGWREMDDDMGICFPIK